MGRGRSKVGGGSSKLSAAATPSGVTYAQFMAMSEQQRYAVMDRIVTDQSISVPSYLDDSLATKVMYALGMNNHPTVVTDAQLDAMSGQEIFRTVNDSGAITASDILGQIRDGDYTQLSDTGGSRFGRAIYFADKYSVAARYGHSDSARVCRAKINSAGTIVTATKLANEAMQTTFPQGFYQNDFADVLALHAIARGYDGWYDGRTGQYMILNRGVLTMSSTNKTLYSGSSYIPILASDWSDAKAGS